MTTNCECGAVGLPGSEVVHGSPLCRDCAERLHNDPHDFDHAEVPFGRCVLCELLGVEVMPGASKESVQHLIWEVIEDVIDSAKVAGAGPDIISSVTDYVTNHYGIDDGWTS